MIAKIEKRDFFYAGISFFTAFFAYILSVYPTVTTEDSGEFISAVYHLGVAHPPGYPLYLFLAKIFTLLIPFGNFGWKVNLFSAFCGALTVAAVYLLLQLVIKNRTVSLIGAFTLAASTFFWEQAIRAEVYSLNSLLLILVTIFILLYAREANAKDKKPARKFLFWCSLILGLSLANHPLMYLAGIPLAVFILVVNWKIIYNYKTFITAILLFALGFCFNLYIPIRASYNPEINWNKPAGWNQMWEHISRDFYAKTAVAEKNLYAPAAAPPAAASAPVGAPAVVSSSPYASAFTTFFGTHIFGFHWRLSGILANDFLLLILLLIPAGFVFLYKKDKKIFTFFCALWFFYGPVASYLIGLGYTGGKLPYILFTDRPFIIPIIIIAILLAVIGLNGFLEMLKPGHKKIAIYILLPIVLLNLYILKLPSVSQSGNYIAYDIVKTAFNRLPKDTALLLEGGDNTIFPLLYIQKVEMVRPDINVYMTAPINIFNYANNYDTIINDNPGKPIFVDYFFRDRAFSYDGLFGQLSVDNSRNFPNRVITSWPEDIIRGIDKANLDHFNKYTAANYYVALGMTMYGNPNQNELFKKAMDKAPDSVNLIAKYIGNYLAQLGNFTDDIPYLEEAVKWMPNDYNAVFQLILSYAVNNKQNKALELYNKLDNETKTSMKSYWTNVAASQNSPPLKDFLSKI